MNNTAVITGILKAPRRTLYAVEVFDRYDNLQGFREFWWLDKALEWAASHGVKAENITVVEED